MKSGNSSLKSLSPGLKSSSPGLGLAKPMSPGIASGILDKAASPKNTKRANIRVDSILERLNPNLEKTVMETEKNTQHDADRAVAVPVKPVSLQELVGKKEMGDDDGTKQSTKNHDGKSRKEKIHEEKLKSDEKSGKKNAEEGNLKDVSLQGAKPQEDKSKAHAEECNFRKSHGFGASLQDGNYLSNEEERKSEAQNEGEKQRISASLEDSNSNTGTREEDVLSAYSNEDSLDGNKSRRKRKPTKTVRVSKDEGIANETTVLPHASQVMDFSLTDTLGELLEGDSSIIFVICSIS